MMSLDGDRELAEALDRVLADRRPGALVPDPDLGLLVDIAHSLVMSVADVTPTTDFRGGARQRLIQRMARTPRVPARGHIGIAERARLWGIRLMDRSPY